MKYLPLALALFGSAADAQMITCSNCTSAAPQGLPAASFCGSGAYNAIVDYSGLGNGGFACSFQPLQPASPGFRAWVITGDKPAPVITVTVDISPIVNKNPSGGWRRGQCRAFPEWTMPEYAEGYPIPEWPVVFADQSAYDANGRTATLRLRTTDPFLTLQPNSNYSLGISCDVRIY